MDARARSLTLEHLNRRVTVTMKSGVTVTDYLDFVSGHYDPSTFETLVGLGFRNVRPYKESDGTSVFVVPASMLIEIHDPDEPPF